MMGSYIVLILFACLVEGVFGDAAEVKSVMEGDSVILNTGVTKGPNDIVWWYFNNTLIAVIDGIRCLYNGVGGMFRDKLMGDRKTGSLIITDITVAHAGRYEAEIYRSEMSGKTKKVNGDLKCDSTRIISKNGNLGETIKSISLTVSGVFGDAAEVKSVMEGDSVILNSGVTKGPNDMVWWYFNNTLIAVIDGIYCLYDGEDGKFRDKLMGDRKTGSLIITNITVAHAGRYEAELKREDLSGKTIKLNRTTKCESARIYKKKSNPEEIIKSISLTVSDSGKNKNETQKDPQDKEKKICSGSGLSPAAVVGIVVVGVVGVGVLLWAAAVVVVVGGGGVMICPSRNDKQVLVQVSEDESFLPAQNGEV